MKTSAVLILILCFTGTSFAQQQEYSFKETYRVAESAKLYVSSFDGHIDVESGPGSEIQVYYVVTRKGKVQQISRQELEKELLVETTSENNSLTIQVRSRHEGRNWFWDSMDQLNVNFRIVTPKSTTCDLHSSDGNISITGLQGNQRIKTSDGHVKAEGINGSVAANTSDGNMTVREVIGTVELGTSDGHIHLDRIRGNATLSTSDGNIELSGIKGNVDARTSDGNIYFKDIAGSFRGRTSDGNIKGNFVELRESLSLTTGDGNISVTLPDRLGLTLDIKGESLHIPLQGFSGETDEHHIHGTTNGGGIEVNLRSSDGSITLGYL